MRFIRVNAWLAVMIVVILSIVPGNLRPHVMESGGQEHFTAYFITAGLLAVGYPRPLQWFASFVMLTISAGLLEFAQFSIPGRTASIGDFAMGTIGASIGVLVGLLITRVHTALLRLQN